MNYIDLRKLSSGELKQIRRQVVRLKEMGKTGKEIEELTGVRQNRASEIWTVYQHSGEAALEVNRDGRPEGSGRILLPEEEAEIRETTVRWQPKEFGIPGCLFSGWDHLHIVDLRKLSSGELKQVRRQVVRLKEMGKTGKEIEELTGVRQNRASEIWTAYQRSGEAALEVNRGGDRKEPGEYFSQRKKQKYGRQS